MSDIPLRKTSKNPFKCVICRKGAVPNSFRCKSCEQDFLQEHKPIWDAENRKKAKKWRSRSEQ